MSNKWIRKKHGGKEKLCPLCEQTLPSDPEERIVGRSGRAICRRCFDAVQRIDGVFRNDEDHADGAEHMLRPPSEILRQLDERIIGQERAKRAVVTALWKQRLRAQGEDIPNAPMLLHGPTGCGKTAMVREAAKLMGLPFLSFDATTISETGYRGREAAEMVKDLVGNCVSLQEAEYGVIFLDEIDKLAADMSNDQRASYCRGTQFSLLKLIEGCEVETEKGRVDTSNILFLFGGAFTGLHAQKGLSAYKKVGFLQERVPVEPEERDIQPDDFVAFGMERELMGRVGRCIALHELSEQQLRIIMLDSKLSTYRKYCEYFNSKGRSLVMEEAEIDRMIGLSVQRGMGARGLNALVEEWAEPRLAALAEELYEHMG